MRVVLILGVCALVLGAASVLAALSYGHFARHARGEDMWALSTEPAFSILDRGIGPRVEAQPGRSGLTLLSDNLDAFAARALTASAAARSLDLMYYYWLDDLTGRLLANELIEAADRGVRVRLLLDDINATGKDSIYLPLDAHPGISVRLFNPSRAREGGLRRGLEMVLRAFSMTRRMHNKAWIADGRLAIIGGRNIGDEYFDAAETSNFRDLDMLMMGPVVRQTEVIFDSFWNSNVSMPIGALVTARQNGLNTLKAGLSRLPGTGEAAPYLDRALERISVLSMLDAGLPTYWTSEARVISDPPEKALSKNPDNWMMTTLMPVIASADRSVEITSPYFVPGVEGTRGLTEMVANGVNVAVLTNSLAATDVAAVHGGYAPYRPQLLAGGVRLYELQPHARPSDMSLFGSGAASLHTKAFTVDSETGFVGSFNFDPRSVSLNTEMGVLFVDKELVRQMRQVFAEETGPAMSYRVYLDAGGNLRWEGERDGRMQVYHREPEAGLTRRITATIVSWLPVESQL
jgi:cardiolipin synthase C